MNGGFDRDSSASYWSAGAPARRPLWDVAGGPHHNRQRVARCQSYVSAARLRVIDGARAESRLDFSRGRRSAAHLDAARSIATAYDVATRRTGLMRNRKSLSLAVCGDAEDVARYIAGVPRVLDYAEALATQAARSYGDWSRHSMARRHLTGLDESERRSRAAQFRAAAFRVIVDVLVGGPDVVLPDVDASLAPWDQVRAVAGGIARYGWVDVGAAYDPAQARKMLAEAKESLPFDELPEGLHAAAVSSSAAPSGEQLPLPLDWTDGLKRGRGLVVVIPCSAAKLTHAAPAGELYVGSLHTHARKTADALTQHGGTVLILSALHGLLPLNRVIKPYDHTWKDEGSITTSALCAQAAALGVAGAHNVILLTPGEYTKRAAVVWPHARAPLAHLAIGKQRSRLTALRENPASYGALA